MCDFIGIGALTIVGFCLPPGIICATICLLIRLLACTWEAGMRLRPVASSARVPACHVVDAVHQLLEHFTGGLSFLPLQRVCRGFDVLWNIFLELDALHAMTF